MILRLAAESELTQEKEIFFNPSDNIVQPVSMTAIILLSTFGSVHFEVPA